MIVVGAILFKYYTYKRKSRESSIEDPETDHSIDPLFAQFTQQGQENGSQNDKKDDIKISLSKQ